MCGICGFTGERNPELITRMMESISHRGPDERGDYFEGDIHLGMVRLSIIDIKGGHQPVSNEDGSVWTVFNGEIYNYIELRKELENKGHLFKTKSDTETIVHGYEEFGIDFLHKLNGMFAIAIWDTRKQTLFLIRDRFGIKPLFYKSGSGELVFGSEIKTLLRHPLVSGEIDYQAISHYLCLRNVPAPFTVYKDIRALLPGHLLTWNRKDFRISRWYHLSMEVKWEEKDEKILEDRIDEILRDSVRLRLRSDVSYGAYLSGGIDSSTVVALMSEFSPGPVKTFCLDYADAPEHKRDAYYAGKVSRLYSTEHYEYVMDWSDLRKELPEVICHLDQPFAGVISSFWLSRFMRKYVTVALSGDGADDLFASYGHHRLVGPVTKARKAIRSGKPADQIDFGFFREKKELALEIAQYHPWEGRLAYAAFMEHEKARLLSRRGKEYIPPAGTVDFLKAVYLESGSGSDELNRMLYLDINTLLPNEILYFNDMLSMANSMEVRTPFLDYRLVELACSIPGSLKIRQMTLKYILRKVAARYLPKEIIERPKEGFVLPKNTWLREGMAPTLADVLSRKRLGIHGFFNQTYVDELASRFFRGDDSVTFKIWTLIVFQIWYENFMGI